MSFSKLCMALICLLPLTLSCETPKNPCVYDGQTHQPDEAFTGTDGCSVCQCTYNGLFECDDSACGLDAGSMPDSGARDSFATDALFADAGDAAVPADAVRQDSASQDLAPHDSAWGNDADQIDPCTSLVVEHVSNATIMTAPSSSQPAVGESFVFAPTGIEVTRMSDASDSNNFSTGYTNGYSRWSPASVSGTYLTAFAMNGGASVYRSTDRTVVRTLNFGEPNELHWDSTGQHESHLYYRSAAQLRRIDVESGDDVLVHDFALDYPGAGAAINGVEGAPSRDMRYWAFQICDSMSSGGQCIGMQDVVVYDLLSDQIVSRLLDTQPNAPIPNFVDISPSGSRIIVGSCAGDPEPFNGMYAWSLDFSSHVRLSTGCTHSGWAYGLNGEEYFVSQDPCGANNNEITFSCDYITAVDVNDAQGWEHRVPVLGLGDLGWGNGIHIGRIYDDSLRGWFFISTYSDSTSNWGTNQLFFVEIVSHEQDPRLWRISPTFNDYQGYWSEAFASLDFHAHNVYWGANWMGQSDLQLYRARLCADWTSQLNGD